MALAGGNEQTGFAARKILRAARSGSLATTEGGQPFVSLVTPATAPDGTILLLLSDLAEHTRHLAADPRCAILVAGLAPEVNPQTAPRLTVTGTAERLGKPKAEMARYLAVHPYAGLYAGFTDFALWRIMPAAGRLVEGFARAFHLLAVELAPDDGAIAALTAAEAGIIAHCNAEHPDAIARIAGKPGAWRMATVDADGCDLAQGETVLRVAWSKPARLAEDVRRELIRLVRKAGTG